MNKNERLANIESRRKVLAAQRSGGKASSDSSSVVSKRAAHVPTVNGQALTVKLPTRSRWPRRLLKLLVVIIFCLLCVVAIEWAPYKQVMNAKPEDYFVKQESRIYQRAGDMMEQPDDNKANKDLVRLKETPATLHDAKKELTPLLQKGVPAVEDKWFGWHFGVNIPRIVIAWFRNKMAGKVVEGASTIHQQVARTFYLNRDKTYERKIAEAKLAVALWWAKSSEEVLGLYTSLVAMGSRGGLELRGFYEASMAWFGKPPTELSIGQQAILAGMPKGPSIFNPGAPRCKERRDLVLHIWRQAGLINEAEERAAKAEPIIASETAVGQNSYAGDKVVDELKRILDGINVKGQTNYKPVEVQAYSTIHPEAQARLAAAIRSQEKAITAQLGDDGWQVTAMLVNVNTREVLAAVGGRDYAKSQFNRLNSSFPTGSAFKPFVYGRGLEYGNIGLMTRLPDAAGLQYSFPGSVDPYEVSNHDDSYDGTASVRTALSKSKNVPAVALEYQLGLPDALELAQKAGLPIEQVPSAVLGPTGATALQVAEAYTSLARGGKGVKLSFFRKIIHGNQVLYDLGKDTGEVDVMSASGAFLVTSALSDVSQPGKGTGGVVRNRKFNFKGVLAMKTGSGQYAWCVGYTPDGLLLVVCIGFDIPGNHTKQLEKLFGGSTSALVHGAFWSGLQTDHANYFRKKDFDVPETVELVKCVDADGLEFEEYAVKGRGCQQEFKVVTVAPTPTPEAQPQADATPVASPTPAKTLEQIANDVMIIDTSTPEGPKPGPTLRPVEPGQQAPVITIPKGRAKLGQRVSTATPTPEPAKPVIAPSEGVITIPKGSAGKKSKP